MQNCKNRTFIKKTGKTEELTNYRPISILTCFSKIFEKLIYSRLISFFQKNSVLHDSQHGFRNGMSTTHAVLDVLTSTCDQINNEQYTGLILLDFKKAFDTVCHTKLLHKLEHNGIRWEALKLLLSFLSNRQQFVSFQNLSSKTLTNNYGLPQGSNLGPLLFLIYINDISNALNSIPRLFADDTCLVIHSVHPDLLRNNITSELQKVRIWTNANAITVNPQKTMTLIIPPKITNPSPDIEMQFLNLSISANDQIKYLGITIDSRLNFEEHIGIVAKKISRSFGVMGKLRNVLPPKVLLVLYYSIIHPHLLYDIINWGNTFEKYLKRLRILQNNVVKVLGGGRWQDHASAYYSQLNILKLEDLYTYEVAKLMHKYSQNKLPKNLSSFFTPVNAIHSRTTRLASSGLNLSLPFYRIEKLQRSYKFQGVMIWNSVPQKMKMLSFNQFKIRLKKHLISKY